MTNVSISDTLVQGVEDSVALSPSVVPLAGITSGWVTHAYYSSGSVVDSSQIGSPATISRLLDLGAITMDGVLLGANSSLSASPGVRAAATLSESAGLTVVPGVGSGATGGASSSF